MEEVVSRNYLVGEHPDSIINIVDASNLERNLYLTTQLLELGVPMVIALNMMDLVRKNGDKIDLVKLSSALGCQIIETSAVKGEGSQAVAAAALSLAKNKAAAPAPMKFSASLENTLRSIQQLLSGSCDPSQLRWFSIKVFERDDKVMQKLNLTKDTMSHIEADIEAAEKELDDR